MEDGSRVKAQLQGDMGDGEVCVDELLHGDIPTQRVLDQLVTGALLLQPARQCAR
ncbi:hypothetical protein D3C73_1336030 [compost metagenome]